MCYRAHILTQPNPGVLVWEMLPARCVLIRHAQGLQPFEIGIYLNGVMVAAQFFSTDLDAADFAIAQMHAYDVPNIHDIPNVVASKER